MFWDKRGLMKKTKNRKRLFSYIFCVFVLSLACNSVTPQSTQTPIPSPTSVVTPTAPTIPPNVITIDRCSKIVPFARIGSGTINQIIYSSDGLYLLLATDGDFSLYDAQSMKKILQIQTKLGIKKIGFDDEENKIVLLDQEGNIYFFSLDSREFISSIEKPEDIMISAISENGKEISSTTYLGIIAKYNLTDLSFEKEYEEAKALPDATFADTFYLNMDYSPEGKYLVVSTFRGEIIIYNTTTYKIVHRIPPLDPNYDNRIFPQKVVFSRNENMAAIQYQNGKTLILDVSKKSQKFLLDGTSPSLSNEGDIIALKLDNKIELYNTNTGEVIQSVSETETALHSIFSPDGKRIAIVFPNKIEFREIENYDVLRTINAEFYKYESIAISNNIVAIGSGSSVELLRSNQEKTELLAPNSFAKFLKFSNDNHSLIQAGGTHLLIWDLETETIIKDIEIDQEILSFEVSKNEEKAVIVTEAGDLRIIDLNTGLLTSNSNFHGKLRYALFANNDSSIIALDVKNDVLIADVNKLEFSNLIGTGDTKAIYISADTKEVIAFQSIVGGGNKISLYDTENKKWIDTFSVTEELEEETSSRTFAVSPIVDLIAIPGNDENPLKLIEINGTNVCEIEGLNINANQILFSPDGTQLIVIDQKGMIHFIGINQSIFNS